MMNYVWAGLILFSFLFAVGNDLRDLASDPYHNGKPLELQLAWSPPKATNNPSEVVSLAIRDDAWQAYFGRERSKDESDPLVGSVVRGVDRAQIYVSSPSLPAPLPTIRKFHDADDKTLIATVVGTMPAPNYDGTSIPITVRFSPVRFIKLKAINEAAIAFAQKAFEVVLSLVGGLALWLGLLKIAEDAGLVNLIVKVIRPILRPLFPDVPSTSPALGLIALNVAANMLALGNAATPIGIKAMQELQKLNPTKDTATNAMVMLLAINTAGVTLLPSPSLVGIMGPRIGIVMGPILITTALSLAIAIVTCKLLQGRSPVPTAE